MAVLQKSGARNARVIGVIADVRETNAENGAGWQMYLPVSQSGPEGAYLVVRSKLPAATLAPSVMKTLRQINPEQPATEFKPIQNLVDHATSPRRFFMLLVSIFAGLGLLLASLGIYGVISYSVTRQTQEIGIRMALGATQGHVLLGVITNTLRLALAGIVLGIAASFVMARLIASLLFGTAPTDPATFTAMALLLCGVACLAGYARPPRRKDRPDAGPAQQLKPSASLPSPSPKVDGQIPGRAPPAAPTVCGMLGRVGGLLGYGGWPPCSKPIRPSTLNFRLVTICKGETRIRNPVWSLSFCGKALVVSASDCVAPF